LNRTIVHRRRHFDARALSALVRSIATTNLFNRVNVTTRQIVGNVW
jgi:alkylhydroperoxidase family enzyme